MAEGERVESTAVRGRDAFASEGIFFDEIVIKNQDLWPRLRPSASLKRDWAVVENEFDDRVTGLVNCSPTKDEVRPIFTARTSNRRERRLATSILPVDQCDFCRVNLGRRSVVKQTDIL